MKRLFLCALCLLVLSGCLGGLDISERALVQLMGIDYERDGFRVTLQVFSPLGQNEGSTVADKQQILSVEGATLSEALYNASLRIGRRVFLGDTRAVVIGEAASETRLDYILRFLADNNEIYPQVVVMVAAGKAGDIVSPQTEENQVLAAHSLAHLTSSAAAGQTVYPSSLLSISKDYYAEGAGAALLRVRRKDEGDQVLFVPDGVALFSDRGPAGRLSDDQHRGMLYLRGLGEGVVFDVDDPVHGRVTLEIRRVRVHVRPALQSGRPLFDIALNARLILREASGNIAAVYGDRDTRHFAELAADAMTADMNAAIGRAAQSGSDVFGFYRYLRRSEPAYWRENGYNWPEIMGKSSYDVRVYATIGRLGNG